MPPVSRTRRFLGGVALGSLQLALATVVGLWMTPFLLRRLGSDLLGFWLVAQQLLGYILLLDLGVNALLPREVAFATGRAGGVAEARDLPHVVARARVAVWWQLPAVAAVAIAAAVLVPERWAVHAAPLGLVLAAVVLFYPARLYQALLQGVQELPFLSALQLLSWSAMTLATVVLVLEGAGLWALVGGWAIGQVTTVSMTWWRVRTRYRASWPDLGLRPGSTEVRRYVKQAAWISVAQVAQVLLTGSDLVMVGTLVGAGAVVQYSCTSKLTSVLANHPQLIMVSATPALSEMWATGRRERLLELMTALTLGMLTVSGLIACLVLAANAGFVAWWVGASQYGGTTLTLLFVLQLLLRHWNITLIYGLICFGQERRVSITNLVDGAVSISLAWGLIPHLGAHGAVLGSIIAVLVTSLPANHRALAGSAGTTLGALGRALWPWASRAVPLGAACAALPLLWRPHTFIELAVLSSCVVVVYGSVMAQALDRSPLGDMVRARLEPLLGPRIAWLRAA